MFEINGQALVADLKIRSQKITKLHYSILVISLISVSVFGLLPKSIDLEKIARYDTLQSKGNQAFESSKLKLGLSKKAEYKYGNPSKKGILEFKERVQLYCKEFKVDSKNAFTNLNPELNTNAKPISSQMLSETITAIVSTTRICPEYSKESLELIKKL